MTSDRDEQDPASTEASEAFSPEHAQQVLSQEIFHRFIKLLLFARQGNGTWDEDSELSHFHVVLSWSGEPTWWVRINEEPFYWTAPRAVRDLEVGETLRPEDLFVEPAAEVPDGTERFITGTWNGQSWDLQLQLDHPDPARLVHLDAGLEFAAIATSCLDRRQLRGFHENAFHATEHLAKAELLSYAAAAPEISESRSHGRLRGVYQLWAHLDNTEQRFARLLQDLDSARSAVTYCVGADRRDEAKARAQQATLTDMVTWVRDVVHGRGRRQIRLYLNQDTAAGQLVSQGATSLRPPKK